MTEKNDVVTVKTTIAAMDNLVKWCLRAPADQAISVINMNGNSVALKGFEIINEGPKDDAETKAE